MLCQVYIAVQTLKMPRLNSCPYHGRQSRPFGKTVDPSRHTVVYATTGHVTSERIRQMLLILELNAFTLADATIKLPSRAYKPPTKAPMLKVLDQTCGPEEEIGIVPGPTDMIHRYRTFLKGT